METFEITLKSSVEAVPVLGIVFIIVTVILMTMLILRTQTGIRVLITASALFLFIFSTGSIAENRAQRINSELIAQEVGVISQKFDIPRGSSVLLMKDVAVERNGRVTEHAVLHMKRTGKVLAVTLSAPTAVLLDLSTDVPPK